MYMSDRKQRPPAAHRPPPRPASQRPEQAPLESLFGLRQGTSSQAGTAPSSELTDEERQRYFEPHEPAAVSTPPQLQRKPTLSSRGDPFEREADEVAAKVMRMEEPAPIQRKPATSATAGAELDVDAAVRATGRGGAPLPETLRNFFEPRFGQDFSQVRVHSDDEAASATRAVQARAYTHGSHIVFGSGEYAPATTEGKRLLAHELAHVVQQGGASPSPDAPGQAAQSIAPQVQRYDSYEHAQLGDMAKNGQEELIQGIKVTPGELNALADFYATPDDLASANPTELKELLRLIRMQRANPASVSEKDWDDATGGRYTELNLKNAPHFSPRDAALLAPPAGMAPSKDNRSTWSYYHEQALALARKAALEKDRTTREELYARARLINGFAEHYLEDAFSAGHLFSKADALGVIQQNMARLTSKELNLVLKYVADWIWNIPALSAMISQYETDTFAGWDISSASRFQAVLEGIHEARPDAVANAIIKAIHDKLNTWKDGGALGIPVENDYDKWLLSGDRTLSTSPMTQTYVAKALEQGRANLRLAYESSAVASIPNDTELAKKVLTYFPRLTAASTTLIHDMLARLTDPKNRADFATAVASVIAGELPTILQTLVEMKKLRKKKP